MLDVHRRGDADPPVQDVLDVLVALAVARLGQIRMRELVDERELGSAPDHSVDVHLGEHRTADGGPKMRHHLEALGERGRLGPVVRLEVADHDVDALPRGLLALLQHPVGLADPGRHAEQDPVVPSQAVMPRRRCGR